jgi:protein-disulfide isomerase
VNGHVVTDIEIIGSRLLKLQTDIYNSEMMLLDRAIDDLVIKYEASSRGIPVDQLLKEEVGDCTEMPTQEELRELYLSNRTAYRDIPEDVALPVIRERAHRQRLAERKTRYARSLWPKYRAVEYLRPPRAANLPTDGPAIGPRNAAVQIVEFADFQCPFCGDAGLVVRSVQNAFPSDVRIVFKNLPLPSHASAQKAAEAASCADRQGRFWDMHDKLFANQRHLNAQDLTTYAKDLGLDTRSFDECLRSNATMEVWERDRASAADNGVAGTPTFFINGRMLTGVISFDRVKRLVEEELQQGHPKTQSAGRAERGQTTSSDNISVRQ